VILGALANAVFSRDRGKARKIALMIPDEVFKLRVLIELLTDGFEDPLLGILNLASLIKILEKCYYFLLKYVIGKNLKFPLNEKIISLFNNLLNYSKTYRNVRG